MIEKFISYSDLLALLLAIAISGLIIFTLFFIGFITSEAEHVGSDSDIDSDVDTDVDTDLDHDFDTGMDVDTDLDHEFDTGIDTDIGTDLDTDFDGVDTDFDTDMDVDTDLDHDIDTDVDTDTDVDHDIDHDVHIDSDLHMDVGAHVDGELVKTIETDGGGSLFAQIGAFCLAFGLFGFFFILSLGPAESSQLVNKLDIAVVILFILGVGAYKLSNKGLKILTKGSISPISEIMAGQKITVVSTLIDYQTQGRVLVLTPDGEKIMMAIANDMHDLFYAGDQGIILSPGIPLRIIREQKSYNGKMKGVS